jgi:hypothetical protein
MWIRRAVAGIATVSMLGAGLLVLPSPAQGAGPTDRLFWSAATTGTNQLWGSTASTVPAAIALPSGSALTGIYRALATDGTHLYFSDGTNLVRTALNGTGKTTIVAGVSAAEQIVVSSGTLYYSVFSTGIWAVGASATGASASNILTSSANYGWDGVAVSGTTLYALNYTDGLYQATLNGFSSVTGATINSNADVKGGVTKLLADGATLYAAGVANKIVHTTNTSLPRSSWSTIDTSAVAGTVFALAKLDSTLYYTVGTGIASIGTNGTGNTRLSGVGQFASVWSIAVAPPETFTVTYDGNLNTGGAVPVDSLSPYTSGSTVTVLGNTGSLTKTDYQFARWDTTANNTGTSRQPGATFTIGGNTVLYALWVGGPFEFRTDPSGPAIATAAFPSGSNGQQKDLTLYVRNVGAAATIGVPASAVGAPLGTSTCPRVGGTIQQYNPAATPPVTDCTFNLTWTVSGNLSGVFSFANGMPTSSSVALTGVALSVARTPTFSSPVSTADGFTVNVTNWDSNWTWTPTVGSGTVTAGTGSGSTLPLTVTGLAASASATVAVTTTRSNYFDGSATVVGTASAASGGGGGGGGTSTPSTDTPTTTTTTPTTPTTVTPAAPSPLGPEEGLPVTTLTPGGTTVATGGQPTPVTTVPNKAGGTVTSSGDDWSLTTGGRTPAGKSQPTSPTGVVQVPQGGSVVVSGKGYESGTSVQVYAMNPALLLGTFTVGADGTFRDSVTWPAGLATGAGVLQVNGFCTSGAVRSYSLGIGVIKDASGKVRTVERTVYFAAGSSWLSPTAKAALAKTVASVPKGATLVSVVATGYVQGTRDRSNDFTLSTARATKAAAQMKADKLVGKYYVTGRGVAKESGALGRKVIVMVTYR